MNIFKNKRLMDIKTYGDGVLKKTAARVDEINQEIKDLAKDMEVTMFEADGVGLAAPQVGVSLRMVLLGVPASVIEKSPPRTPGELLLLPRMPLALINPEITPITDHLVKAEEGCLSVPQLYAQVVRPERIMLSAQLIDGERINAECGGFLARVIQHEIDHLDGVLFVDRLDKDEFNRIKDDLNQLEKKKKGKKRK